MDRNKIHISICFRYYDKNVPQKKKKKRYYDKTVDFVENGFV